MKKLPNCVLRYQKDVVYALYQLLKKHKVTIDFTWETGTACAVFYIGKHAHSFPLSKGDTMLTEQLDDFACTLPPDAKRLKRFLQELSEFCHDYDVTIYSPGLVCVGNHEVLVEFKLAAYDLYSAWQHMDYPDDEEEEEW